MDQAQPLLNHDDEQNSVITENPVEQNTLPSLTEPGKLPQLHFSRDVYLGLGIAAAFILFSALGSVFFPNYARETYLVPTMILVVALVLVMVFYQVNVADDR